MTEDYEAIKAEVARRLAALPVVTEPTRCGLCGHIMTVRCGYGRGLGGIPLCHCDDHDCYHLWTVYGRRRVAT